MKITKTLYLLLSSIMLLSFGCKKSNSSTINAKSVSIIGIDPCTQGGTKKGYVLLLNATNETVLTFNLPQSLVDKVSASPKFKDASLYAPESVVTANLNYHTASKEETVFYTCVALYITYTKQVVIDGVVTATQL